MPSSAPWCTVGHVPAVGLGLHALRCHQQHWWYCPSAEWGFPMGHMDAGTEGKRWETQGARISSIHGSGGAVGPQVLVQPINQHRQSPTRSCAHHGPSLLARAPWNTPRELWFSLHISFHEGWGEHTPGVPGTAQHSPELMRFPCFQGGRRCLKSWDESWHHVGFSNLRRGKLAPNTIEKNRFIPEAQGVGSFIQALPALALLSSGHPLGHPPSWP